MLVCCFSCTVFILLVVAGVTRISYQGVFSAVLDFFKGQVSTQSTFFFFFSGSNCSCENLVWSAVMVRTRVLALVAWMASFLPGAASCSTVASTSPAKVRENRAVKTVSSHRRL
eukprot:TRINITY_DN17340_c0_g2_i1.p2 TRINITY_DN17340_c0_g2~~TRINITY_DN17340_c0_g2_i1.p2  ORF type:complete len:114 (-),score=14.81 TRINITY_DN17340_c0_g2_i1:372-713(-)